MKRSKYTFLGLCLGLTVLSSARPALAQQTGTLVLELKNFTSDAKIPKKSQKNLAHAGVRWEMVDDGVLISLVNERFVKADLPNLTRFGEQKAVELKPGRYSITCIGYDFSSTSRDIDKVLAKSAFFNNDVMTFTVSAGKTTTLEIAPVYKAESQWWVLSKFTMFLPDLKVRVLEDGTPQGDEVVINRRTEKSVAWNDYHGPLKF
jgi:hypothetical protein